MKKSHTNRLWAIILISMALCCVSILVVSAYEFDNAKSFNKTGKYGIATITNAFGLGDKLAEIELTSNTAGCSNNCYAEGRTTLYTTGKLIDNLRFEYGSVKSYKIYIQDGVLYSKPEECKVGNLSCPSKPVEYPVWKEYDNKELTSGTYYWRIEGVKDANVTVDWIGNWQGVDVGEWTLWGTPYNNTIYSGVWGTWAVNPAVKTGMTILTKNPIYIQSVKVEGGGDSSTAYIQTALGGGVLATATITSGWAVFSSPVQLSTATKYYVLVDKAGAVYNGRRTNAGSVPFNDFNFTDFNYTGQIQNDGNEYAFNLANLVEIMTINITSPAPSTYNISEISQSYNTSTWETSSEGFNINISYNTTMWSAISVQLIYNGTGYATTQSGTGDNLVFYKAMTIPKVTKQELKNVYWLISVTNATGTFQDNSTLGTQQIDRALFQLCNATTSIRFLNLTAKDEATLSKINFTIPLASYTYWLGDGSVNQTYSYTNVSMENKEYAFCFSPANKQPYVTSNIQYASTGYPQRVYVNNSFLSNGTTNTTLYLLGDADGIYVTFQILTPAETPIANVYGTATRNIGGTDYLVGSGTSGADGGITMWLNPDFIHTFTFVATGYDTYTTSFMPTSTSYTVVMGTGTTSSGYDYTRGITYSINPSEIVLVNNTNYHFNFTISSSYWSLDKYGFALYYSNGTVGNLTSDTTGTGGTIDRALNTLNMTSITMRYYYVINGTYMNMSRTWLIYEGDSAYSIWNFINRFKTYTSDGIGIFGLRDNSLGINILIYIIILAVVGICSYKFGLTTPSAVLGVLFVMVALFDVVLGLMYNPIDAVPNFPTILIGIIMVGSILREVYQ